ncbi:MAG: isoprenylcysteine carboxylmethyltransferase family protein [Anaerolineae bacterium]|nr:isoprenylcysteine carboxylmethyltransferase family protein [Anaerolineae bacterium]
MGNEIIFRGSLGVVSTLLACVRLYYGWLASQVPQKIASRREGKFSTPLLWFFGLLGVATSTLYIVAPAWLKWTAFSIPTWLRWIGVGFGGVTLLLFWWVHHALGQNWSMPVVIRENQTLVTNGPYRWVRHPMYTTIFVWALAYFLISANWLIGVAWLRLGLVTMAIASAEEEAMIEKFGEAYRAYAQRTGRFLPRWKG